ncbi:MAG: hypothetical protein AAFU03_04460, partial [Bacteroidota bacterium]
MATCEVSVLSHQQLSIMLFKHTLSTLTLLLFCATLTAQSATFIIPDTSTEAGNSICLPVTVEDFSDIVEFGFSVTWAEGLSFTGIQNIHPLLNDFNVVNVGPVAPPGTRGINTFFTDGGGLAAYWNLWENGTCEGLPAGLDLPDGDILFEICLFADGGYGQLLEVDFFNEPQPLIVNKKNGNGTCTEDAVLGIDNGSVTLGVSPLELTVNVPEGNFQPGDLVCVDILAESGFTNMQGLQFALDWDRAILQIESVIPNEEIPNNVEGIYNVDVANNCFSTAWSFTLPNQDVTLAPNTVFAQACFRIIGDCNDQTTISVNASCNGAPIEASNTFDGISLIPVISNDGRLRIQNCNSFGLDVIVCCPPPAEIGDQTCVEIKAGDNFQNISDFAYFLRFNPDILEFVSVGAFGSGLGMNSGDFNTDNIGNGILGVDWNSSPFPPVSKNNEDVLYEVCFIVIGYAEIVPITVSDPSSVNSNTLNLIVIDPVNCEIYIVEPNRVIMTFGSVDVSSAAEQCLPIMVSNFTDITATTFTVQFDGSLFEYDSFDNLAIPGATVMDFGSGTGLVTFTYNGPGVTLADGATLFDLCLRATDDAIPGECGAIGLGTVPFQPSATSSDNTIDGIIEVPGEVCTLFPEGFGLIINSATQGVDSTVCVEVEVVSFDNINSAEFSISFDPTVLTWNGVFLTGAWPGLTADDFVDTGSGRINVSWQTDTGPGFIPDSSVVFELCFNTLSTPGCFPIEAFSDAQPSATTTGGDGSI